MKNFIYPVVPGDLLWSKWRGPFVIVSAGDTYVSEYDFAGPFSEAQRCLVLWDGKLEDCVIDFSSAQHNEIVTLSRCET